MDNWQIEDVFVDQVVKINPLFSVNLLSFHKTCDLIPSTSKKTFLHIRVTNNIFRNTVCKQSH